MKPRRCYSTELSDGELEILQPGRARSTAPGGRPRAHQTCELLAANFYVVRGGCTWCLLPHDFPPLHTAYHNLIAWRIDKSFPSIRHLWADGGYRGSDLRKWITDGLGLFRDFVQRRPWWVWVRNDVEPEPIPEGFEVIRRRWVVERTFAWICRNRTMSRDYEFLAETTER